jgi:hypothetical protein
LYGNFKKSDLEWLGRFKVLRWWFCYSHSSSCRKQAMIRSMIRTLTKHGLDYSVELRINRISESSRLSLYNCSWDIYF